VDGPYEIPILDSRVYGDGVGFQIRRITLAVAASLTSLRPIRRSKKIPRHGADVDVSALGIDASNCSTDAHQCALRQVLRRIRREPTLEEGQ
jgi:hypothetical protein